MKKVIIAFVVCLLVVVLLWPESVLTIRHIETGNTVVLSNGTTVRLLGVSPTEEAKQQLSQYRDRAVELVHDRYSFNVENLENPDDNGRILVVNAYLRVVDRDKVCVNAELLKSGSTMLVENVYDSLDQFRRYAQMGESRRGGGEAPKVVSVIDYKKDDIQLDPYEPSKDRKHSAWYNDGNMNLEMLEEACDFNLPYTKKFANELAARKPGPFNPGQICEVYAYCSQKWSYVNDPIDSEYVAKASETISCSLIGDCDDFAVLIASCMLAIGGRPCINTGANSSGGHAFTEVDISQFNEAEVLAAVRDCFPAYNITKLNCRRDGEYVWLNLDWMTPYPGGDYYDCSLSREAYPYISGRWEWRHLN